VLRVKCIELLYVFVHSKHGTILEAITMLILILRGVINPSQYEYIFVSNQYSNLNCECCITLAIALVSFS